MGELLSVKVSIANRTYPLRITHDEQERVLKAAEMINKRVRDFEEAFAVKDKQDLLAMAALHFANEAMGQDTSEKSGSSNQEYVDRIDGLTSLLDEYLTKEASSL
jgi:cell division protein ZapA (FtsZ GTPase activity inhibitor)